MLNIKATQNEFPKAKEKVIVSYTSPNGHPKCYLNLALMTYNHL